MLNKYFWTLLMVGLLLTANAQAPKKPNSAEIHEAIKKLNVLGSALYVAAHPDDENTRMIAYLANELKMNTAYLSMTRGDGGQNLIGPEIRELLGVIRTQELLAARGVDGGQQFFTRANDFGYSKNPAETFEIWNKDEVLSDVVWTIRKFKPDVIINRFSTRPRRTHGHHTGSAILSKEAFDLVGDSTKYSDQLKYVDIWQPKRLMLNTSWWFYGSREKFAKVAKDNMITVDVGVYYPMKGKSNTEIAAESRSMHKCQGFGSTGRRGVQIEYLEHIKGDKPAKTIFEGINTTWTRLEGGEPIGALVTKIDDGFKPDNPAASIPDLLKTRKMIEALPAGHWKTIKLKEINQIIKDCAGIFIEATADDYTATRSEKINIKIEAINRSNAIVNLRQLIFHPEGKIVQLEVVLENNRGIVHQEGLTIPNNLNYSSPYWLREQATLGMYTVGDRQMIGKPETPRELKVTFDLSINGELFSYEVPIVYKKNDPVKGETYRPFEVTPPVFANIDEQVYVFADNEPKTVNVLIKAGRENVRGTLELKHPKKWKVEPASVPFTLELKGEERLVSFKVYPSKKQSVEQIKAVVKIGEQTYDKALILIEYDHIPTQTVLKDATAKVVRVDLKKRGKQVGYIMGAGDAIPESLEQIGYEVTLLKDKDLSVENLKQYDAVILGVRAYNTVPRLKFHQSKLMKYVEEGGTVIVQYNTSHRLVLDEVGPYPIKLSRDRVAMEDAPVKILKPKHQVINEPNKISQKDFDNWVQERGLYFPSKWDDKYEAILSSHDKGEPARDGGLLVAKYGQGYYIYTGYSWFRELPAGVPGAYRLFTNLISIGENP